MTKHPFGPEDARDRQVLASESCAEALRDIVEVLVDIRDALRDLPGCFPEPR